MIQEFKKVWKPYTIGLLWLLGLLWPLLGIHPDGTLSFDETFTVWLYIAIGTTICLLLYVMNKSGSLDAVSRPLAGLRDTVGQASGKVPNWVWIIALLAFAFLLPVLYRTICPGRGHQRTDLCLSGAGAQHRRGAGRHAGSGLHCLLRRRRIHLRPFEYPLRHVLLDLPALCGRLGV